MSITNKRKTEDNMKCEKQKRTRGENIAINYSPFPFIILTYLRGCNLAIAAQVNKEWNHQTKNDNLWKSLFAQYVGSRVFKAKIDDKHTWREFYIHFFAKKDIFDSCIEKLGFLKNNSPLDTETNDGSMSKDIEIIHRQLPLEWRNRHLHMYDDSPYLDPGNLLFANTSVLFWDLPLFFDSIEHWSHRSSIIEGKRFESLEEASGVIFNRNNPTKFLRFQLDISTEYKYNDCKCSEVDMRIQLGHLGMPLQGWITLFNVSARDLDVLWYSGDVIMFDLAELRHCSDAYTILEAFANRNKDGFRKAIEHLELDIDRFCRRIYEPFGDVFDFPLEDDILTRDLIFIAMLGAIMKATDENTRTTDNKNSDAMDRRANTELGSACPKTSLWWDNVWSFRHKRKALAAMDSIPWPEEEKEQIMLLGKGIQLHASCTRNFPYNLDEEDKDYYEPMFYNERVVLLPSQSGEVKIVVVQIHDLKQRPGLHFFIFFDKVPVEDTMYRSFGEVKSTAADYVWDDHRGKGRITSDVWKKVKERIGMSNISEGSLVEVVALFAGVHEVIFSKDTSLLKKWTQKILKHQ